MANVFLSMSVSPFAPVHDRSTISQWEYLSTTTVADMVEVVGADVLEGVFRVRWLHRGHVGLGGGDAVAGCAVCPRGGNVLVDTRPEDGCFCSGGHA